MNDLHVRRQEAHLKNKPEDLLESCRIQHGGEWVFGDPDDYRWVETAAAKAVERLRVIARTENGTHFLMAPGDARDHEYNLMEFYPAASLRCPPERDGILRTVKVAASLTAVAIASLLAGGAMGYVAGKHAPSQDRRSQALNSKDIRSVRIPPAISSTLTEEMLKKRWGLLLRKDHCILANGKRMDFHARTARIEIAESAHPQTSGHLHVVQLSVGHEQVDVLILRPDGRVFVPERE